MSLLSRLFLLVALALLPAIAIQAYNEVEVRRSREEEVHEQARGIAMLAAADQQQIIQGIRQVLIALSELPAIKGKDAEACNAYFSTLKQRFPAFITFAAVDLNGDFFCDTNSPHRPLTVAGRAYFANALRTGAFTVGEFSIGRSTGHNVVQFALPFYGNGSQIGGLVVAALSLDWVADYISQKGAPPGAALAIIDRNGTYLARYPDSAGFVGKEMPDRKYLGMDHPITAVTRDSDGAERITGYAALPVASGGLLVSFGLDKARAFEEIERRMQRGILSILLGSSLALALTWLGARRFIDCPLGRLVDAANQWRLGNFGRRVEICEKQSEFARVGNVFNSMAEALADRERELRQAKEKAEQAAARITAIFESTTDSVITVDRDWHITYLNERAKMQLAEGRNLVGMDLWEAFPQAACSEAYGQFQAVSSAQRPARFDMFCPQNNAWYEINAFPSGQGLTTYLRDVTEHKHALEAHRLIEEQLHQSQKMEAVGQLTGGVAHDFNNLLTVIFGNLELIEDRAGDNNRVKQPAAAAREAADRGAKLTGQLLALSRQQRLNPAEVYADHLVREFLGLLRQAVGEHCEIKLSTDEELWPCHVDPAQLETALLNLALNGRDAMPNGGVLEIATRNVVVDDKAVTGLPPGAYISLSVTDCGCGIPSETRDRVFEPFFTTKEVGKGTGLGLSMVYGFVKQSGGHVTIESTVGVGTCVTLYLPKASADCGIKVEERDAEKLPARCARILVVEDDEQVLQVTTAMLTQLGHQISCARNGADAIRMLRSDKIFDLLFTDVVMPQGMSGIELARHATRLRNGIKVLLTSGYPRDQLVLGEFPIISKPFRRAELARDLRSVLSSE